MKNHITILLVFLTTVLTSCGGSDAVTQSRMDTAVQALEEGHIQDATTLCNKILQSADTSLLDWKDYCRAAVVYAVAYDSDYNTEVSMASAIQCIDRARCLQPDSVDLYITTLRPEHAAAFNTVTQTVDGLNTDRTAFGELEEDDTLALTGDTIPTE